MEDFSSNMNWNMRLYFVITECLIKKKIVSLFSGLAMADDLNTFTRKILVSAEKQEEIDYD